MDYGYSLLTWGVDASRAAWREPTVGRLSTGFSLMARVRYAKPAKLFLVNVVIGVIGQLQLTRVMLPENSTWYVMSHLPKALDKEVGNLYGLRTWVEYGGLHCKNNQGLGRFSDDSRFSK